MAELVRRAAQAMGKSLNQVVREYLEQLAGDDQLEVELAAYRASTAQTPGRLAGWTFDREAVQRGA